MSVVSTQIQLVQRPHGWPEPSDFRTAEVTYGDVQPGHVRVRNEFISVDPYMRGRMMDTRSYVPPFQIGETMTGGAVGRVVESAVDDLPVGTLVLHQFGWRDIAQESADGFRAVPEPPAGHPSSVYLGVLGLTGFTAYVGLLDIAQFTENDVVFVSGAAGAVGTIVGQIAKLKGSPRVIGSAGSKEKVEVLTAKYSYDVAFDYKTAPVRRQLAQAAPDGIDVYFDNVGGDHLEAALDAFNDGGRAALCGAISQYNSTSRPEGPDNMANIITRGLTLRGFIVAKHSDLMSAFNREMSQWLADGEVDYDETVVDGIGNSADAFIGMMRGQNTGKMVVKV
ncbi:NADP-dependent oxidoreductase [Williamsia sterculiae]|uniref:Enoyl reductase (ER) domain-containing protein n=1 Tax=Williamsia sterculiae TaxID=1344003 RepID=A0A1N7HAM5_9NOCA|nr:NADP-dependent oxidoreductase [Williamsia sterculiae]SIS21939.1 hypothetical protein SAMN05445060_3834 [Williamsia sterculiae]